jgi:hypothetical protein
MRTAHEATHVADAASAEAAVLRHASIAKEAKQACQLEALRAEAASMRWQLNDAEGELAAASLRADAAERQLLSTHNALSGEVRKLEGDLSENYRLLREFRHAHDLKAEHLMALQQQTAKSSTLLAHMQEQATGMQKRLASQQRKSLRLQESQHLVNATAKSWGQERKQLLVAAAHAEQSAREATARQAILEGEVTSLTQEVEHERERNSEVLRQHREVSYHAEASLRGELRGYQLLHEALINDNCKVTLKSGSVCTVGQYVKAVGERQQRQSRSAARAAIAQLNAPPVSSATSNPTDESGGNESDAVVEVADPAMAAQLQAALQAPSSADPLVMLGGAGGAQRAESQRAFIP